MGLRKTKLVATIGPASDDQATQIAMLEAGMDVARLNFSHGNEQEHAARAASLREASQKSGKNVALMLDTRGVEIRTGDVEGDATVLVPEQDFALYLEERTGGREGVSVNQAKLAEHVGLGDTILLDDGRIELEVVAVQREEIGTVVKCGGTLRSRRGLNIPGKDLSLLPRLQDRMDLAFAVEHEVDYIAASFTQSAEDIQQIRRFLAERGAQIPIIAKIENRAAVENLDEIIAEADGTMVARGDLGVELPMAEVPTVQKRIIQATVTSGKPVVTATQMLDSMERNPRPTRAEVSDVANAIFDGTSAVMLSGETAVGKYPVESVSTMAALALEAEASLGEYGYLQKILPNPSDHVTEAVSQAAITMANHLEAAAIVCLTESGKTARQISKYRPECPILAVTMSESVVRRLAMNWGVFPLRYEGEPNDEKKVRAVIERALAAGFVKSGDLVVATGSAGGSGPTNMIRVLTV